MTTKALIDSFSMLETQLGLRASDELNAVFESETHRVSVALLDRHSTVSCDVALKALRQSSVDAYSIISFYHSEALDGFLRSAQKRTDEVVANFVAREISGPCAIVFQIAGTTEWMRLHQHHLQSLRRRNDAFWTRVGGFDEGNNLSEQATY